jgi:uncharacterized protein YndB with AHSA1/START domain
MQMAAEASNEADREIVVSRIIEGPRRLVFNAFTSATHLGQWCAPKGGKITTHAFDFKPGGVWDATIQGPDGSAYPNRWEWKEIVPPERIVWLYGSGNDAVPTTVTLVERGAATEVTLRILYSSKEERDEKVKKYYAAQGAKQSLDSLAAYVAPAAAGGRE